MIEQLITSSFLILAVLLLRMLLRGRVSRRMLYGLWLVVALRLLLPISIPSPVSVMNAVDPSGAQQFINQQVIRVNPDLSDALSTEEDSPSREPAASPISRGMLLHAVWLGGAVATGLTFAVVNLSFSRRLRRQRQPFDAPGCPLPVYLAKDIPSPCLFGLLRPSIYISPQAAEDESTLSHVLTHEYCHFRQWDHIWSLVRTLCLSLYWFHPLVWAAAAYSRSDCELACDELAVATLGEEQKLAYSRTLVELVREKPRFSHLAYTATTMALGQSNMKERILMIVKSPKTSCSALAAVLVCLALLVSCTFTGKTLTGAQAVDSLEQSIHFQDNSIAFTLPAGYANAEDWNIQVYGRAGMDGAGMSIHLFEAENSDRSWQAGKTYTIDLAKAQYLELSMDISLYSDESLSRTVDLLAKTGGDTTLHGYNTVYVTFPAYQDGRTADNSFQYDTQPFDAVLQLPQNWKVSLPAREERATGGPLWTSVEIYDENGPVATMGFSRYERYEGGDLPREEYYKAVYPNLRLGSFVNWGDYTPVRTEEGSESALATVTYLNPTQLENHPGAMAEVPQVQVPGILCYNDDLTVYTAIQFAEGYGVDEGTLRTIAQSLHLIPSEYGLSGKRFGDAYADRDYSGIQVLDADGNDVSKILIDLWYCASDAYDVDGMVVFETGDWVSLLDNHPQFIELTNYDEVLPKIFTPRAIAQYEASDVVLIQKTADGKVYRLGPWRTGYSYAWALTDLRGLEVQPDRIVAEATYIKNPGYAGAGEDPAYVPEYDTVPFTVVKQNGIWLVDDYTYPERKNG